MGGAYAKNRTPDLFPSLLLCLTCCACAGSTDEPRRGLLGETHWCRTSSLLKGTYWGGNEQSDQPRAKIRWRDFEVYFGDTWKVTPRFTLNYGFRWSYLGQSWQEDDRIGNFVLSLYDPALKDDPSNGMIFPDNKRGIDVGRSLRRRNVDVPAPRLGIAWDPTGKGKWAIRAGYGWFYGRADVSQPIGPMLLNPPFNKTLTWPLGRPLDALGSPVPVAGVGTATSGADLTYKTLGSYQWNFTIKCSDKV